MKFKTKEDLIGPEVSFLDKYDAGYVDGKESGINTAFNHFKERVQLYKKYKDMKYKFAHEHEEVYWDDYTNEHAKHGTSFKDWLFNYCFGDIE